MDRKYVEKKLLDIGISPAYRGYIYITDAMLILSDSKWGYDKEMALYNKIARNNNSTLYAVERAVRRTLQKTREHRNPMKEKYLGYEYLQAKHTLCRLHNLLSMEYGVKM